MLWWTQLGWTVGSHMVYFASKEQRRRKVTKIMLSIGTKLTSLSVKEKKTQPIQWKVSNYCNRIMIYYWEKIWIPFDILITRRVWRSFAGEVDSAHGHLLNFRVTSKTYFQMVVFTGQVTQTHFRFVSTFSFAAHQRSAYLQSKAYCYKYRHSTATSSLK